ncbi:MAG TPA: flavodoxin domain-containing protein [Sunxiuqinia sp.]|nr:flavodoxin domain-containing protein [Sunxiuqinia sp.]
MKTIIIYTSTHGFTDRIVHQLAEKLSGQIDFADLKKNPNPDFSDYERVLVGGSIHLGKIQRRVRHFCENNLEGLQQKKLGLFICGMAEGNEAKQELKNAFPEELHQFAIHEAIFGGEFNFDKMNLLQKFMVRKIAKVEKSVEKVDHEAIDRFAERMERTYAPFLLLV